MKKRILISPEQMNAQVGEFFQKLGMELSQDYNKDLEYQFIVDDYLIEITNLPRIQTKKTIAKECEGNVRAFFDERFLNEAPVKHLLGNYFADFEEFDLVDRYSRHFKNLYTLKIHDYLNVGYFIDTIVVEAYKNEFDFEQIRNYLNFALSYALKIIEKQDDLSPLEVSFSYSDEGFAVQISLNAKASGLKKDLETLKEFSSKSNYFDLGYFAKRERLTFSSLWFKDSKLSSFNAYFFTEVSAKKVETENDSTAITYLEGPDEAISYEPKNIASEQSRKLHLARKFSLFVKNLRANEESPIELASLTVADIDQYLGQYPRQEALKELDLEIKNFIIKLLADEKLYEGVTEYVQKIAHSNLDSHVEEIQKVLGEKSLEDISEIIRVKGGKVEENNEATVVSGWSENKNEEEWKVKRSELVEQIKEEVNIIKSQGRNVIEDDIVRVVSGQLNANPDDVKTVVKGIVEEAVTSELLQKEKLEEAFARRFSDEKATQAQDIAREKQEAQIARMKKIMEQMKAEIIKLRNELLAEKSQTHGSGPNSEQTHEILELRLALTRSEEAIKNKEKMALKFKTDFEQILQAKDEKLALLEGRIEGLKEEFAKSREFANEEKLEHLEVENKRLTARLELANRKINIISENMDKQDNESSLKKDKEISTMKTNFQMAQALIEKMKQERIELESKLAEEKEKYIKLRDEKPSTARDKESDNEGMLAGLASEKKALEDKFKLQSMELKKLEQKLKFTSAQLEQMLRKKVAPPAGAKSNETYIKQLENANSRIQEASTDIAEKKKELIKLKQENVLLTAKVTELEKKLAMSDKKAA